MQAKKGVKKAGNTPRGFLPPDDPVYSTGLIVAGIPVEKRREKEEISREPKRYSHFFTGCEQPIMLRPVIGPAERITVRCYKSVNEVVARFHLFPKVRVAGGWILVVRIDDPKGQAGGKGRSAKKRVSRKSGPRS